MNLSHFLQLFHCYLFALRICFYFVVALHLLQKIIPLQDVTAVRRAKTAGIFPNAIEIEATGKKVTDAIPNFHHYLWPTP